jgi:alpha-galactosidase
VFYSIHIVNLDDCWQVSRDANGTIQADSKAFPSGIQAIIDYVHSRKLKFGLYSGVIMT